MNCAPSSDLGGVGVHDCGGHLVLEKNYLSRSGGRKARANEDRALFCVPSIVVTFLRRTLRVLPEVVLTLPVPVLLYSRPMPPI